MRQADACVQMQRYGAPRGFPPGSPRQCSATTRAALRWFAVAAAASRLAVIRGPADALFWRTEAVARLVRAHASICVSLCAFSAPAPWRIRIVMANATLEALGDRLCTGLRGRCSWNRKGHSCAEFKPPIEWIDSIVSAVSSA